MTSQQYSTSLQYNPYTPTSQDNNYHSAGAHQRYSYQQPPTNYGYNNDPYGYGNDPYGNNRPHTTSDSFYARQLAASYDSYPARPQPNTNNDSYYARQVANEYKAMDYATSEWEYQDYSAVSRGTTNRNGTKHQSLDRHAHTNQSYLLSGAYEEQVSYGYDGGNNAPVTTHQPGPPKKSVGITEPVRETASTTTSSAAGSKKPKKVNKKSSNLGFSKSFYAGDESFYAVEQDHED